jgi:hypothetical protein
MSDCGDCTWCEIWKDLPDPDFPGYMVSNFGRVRGRRGWILRPLARHHGYLSVQLKANGRMKDEQIHRLVLKTFVGPYPEGMVTLHLNNDPGDNRLCNLAFGTMVQNGIQMVQDGRSIAKITPDLVRRIRREYQPHVVTQKMLGERYGLSRGMVGSIVTRTHWQWVSDDEEEVPFQRPCFKALVCQRCGGTGKDDSVADRLSSDPIKPKGTPCPACRKEGR